MDKPKRALSIRQPYAEMILRGVKKIEYRSQPTKIRERVCIYASLKPGPEDYFEDMDAKPGDFPTGVLVGTVEVVDCTGSESDYEWHLAGHASPTCHRSCRSLPPRLQSPLRPHRPAPPPHRNLRRFPQ